MKLTGQRSSAATLFAGITLASLQEVKPPPGAGKRAFILI